MEYQKIISLLDYDTTINQDFQDYYYKPNKLGTKIQVEVKKDARGKYSTDSQIKFETARLCN